MPTETVPAPPGHGQTILVHGNGGPALALWAAGLARRLDPAFAWADLAPVPPGLDKVVRLLMARSSQGAWINGVTGDDILPPQLSPAAFARLLGEPAGGGRMPARLERYLGLPALLQLMAARSTRPDGTSTIVVLGTEVLGKARLGATMGSVEIHRILRREGISCIVTFEGSPPEAVLPLFDQVYHVVAPSAQDWPRSTVEATRGNQLPAGLHRSAGLLAQWRVAGLPPELLSIWSLPGFSPVRPR